MQVRGSIPENIARIEQAVGDPSSGCVMRVLGSHIDITIDQAGRHRWSPCVQMELEPATDSEPPEIHTLVRGLVGPHPNTWTLFAFTNLAIGIIATFALMGALAQMTLRQYPWALWAVGACTVGFAIMYIASQIGRRLAAEQTSQLMTLVRGALNAEADA